MQLWHATYHVRNNAITLRAIVLPGLVVDSIRRASAHAFRHQAGKETKYLSHAVHVIDSASTGFGGNLLCNLLRNLLRLRFGCAEGLRPKNLL